MPLVVTKITMALLCSLFFFFFIISIWKECNGDYGREINVSKFAFLSLHLALAFKACSVKNC